MAFASMHEGIWQCATCGRIHAEYINGCLEDHDPPGKVSYIIRDLNYRLEGR